MRLLFLGDVVGRSGREAVIRELPRLRERLPPDLVVINGENAAGGFGLTEAIYDEADRGRRRRHHARQPRLRPARGVRLHRARRPICCARSTTRRARRGAGPALTSRNGGRVLVVQVMGRVFMDALDDPFAAVERELDACPLGPPAMPSLVDFHAEATTEKQALGHSRRRPRQPRGRHPYPRPDRRPPDPRPAAPPMSPMPACAATMTR